MKLEQMIKDTFLEAINQANEEALLDLSFWIHENGYTLNSAGSTEGQLKDLVNSEPYFRITIFLDKLVEFMGNHE